MRFRDFRSNAFMQPGPLVKSKSWLRNLSCLTVLAAIPCAAGISQAVNGNGVPIHDSTGIPPANPAANPTADANRYMEDSMRLQANQKRITQLNTLRQKEMTADTDKLLQLAHQVKTETTLHAKDSLSVVELRQVEAIEKLARGVRDKMEANVAH
jgi:hypothetical protein